jgi:hypothetical protein
MAYASTLKSRLAKLESELRGDDVTLETLVHASMRQGPLDDETARRIETSRLGRLVIAAAAAPAPVAAAPIPAPVVPPQPAFSLAHAVEEAFGGAPIPAPVVPSWEAPPVPPSAPPWPVHETGRDRFYQRGEVFDSGYDDGDLIPAQPGLSLAALMAGRRSSEKDR